MGWEVGCCQNCNYLSFNVFNNSYSISSDNGSVCWLSDFFRMPIRYLQHLLGFCKKSYNHSKCRRHQNQHLSASVIKNQILLCYWWLQIFLMPCPTTSTKDVIIIPWMPSYSFHSKCLKRRWWLAHKYFNHLDMHSDSEITFLVRNSSHPASDPAPGFPHGWGQCTVWTAGWGYEHVWQESEAEIPTGCVAAGSLPPLVNAFHNHLLLLCSATNITEIFCIIHNFYYVSDPASPMQRAKPPLWLSCHPYGLFYLFHEPFSPLSIWNSSFRWKLYENWIKLIEVYLLKSWTVYLQFQNIFVE